MKDSVDSHLVSELLALLPRLRRFGWGLTGKIEAGDDLVQAACERVLLRSTQWIPGTRLDSWVFRIMRNLHVDDMRAAATRDKHHSALHAETEEGFDGQRAAELTLSLEEVRQALSALPEVQRTALLLVCVEGYSYREAAELLSVPMGTVTSRLTRARKALIEMLKDEDEIPSRKVAT